MPHKDAQLAIDINQAKAMRDSLRSLEASIERRLTRRPITRADESAMAGMQVRADAVYQTLGRRAPPALPYEYPEEYRLRLLDELQPHSASWKGASIADLPADALNQVEQQIFDEARADARCPSDLKPKELRPVIRQDSAGHTVTEFVGKDHFVTQFSPPARRAIFRSAEEYQQISRDNQMARNASVMKEHIRLARRGMVPPSSGAMPVPSTANPVIEVAKAVTRRVRRSGR